MIWKSNCRLLKIFRNGLNELLANYQTLDLPCRFERAGTGVFVPDCWAMKVSEGVTENLKASDQMAWVGVMNSIYNRAEEIVLEEIVYR